MDVLSLLTQNTEQARDLLKFAQHLQQVLVEKSTKVASTPDSLPQASQPAASLTLATHSDSVEIANAPTRESSETEAESSKLLQEAKDFRVGLEFLVQQHMHLQAREAYYAELEAQHARAMQQLGEVQARLAIVDAENAELKCGAALFARKLAEAQASEADEYNALVGRIAALQTENAALRALVDRSGTSFAVEVPREFMRKGVRSEPHTNKPESLSDEEEFKVPPPSPTEEVALGPDDAV